MERITKKIMHFESILVRKIKIKENCKRIDRRNQWKCIQLNYKLKFLQSSNININDLKDYFSDHCKEKVICIYVLISAFSIKWLGEFYFTTHEGFTKCVKTLNICWHWNEDTNNCRIWIPFIQVMVLQIIELAD